MHRLCGIIMHFVYEEDQERFPIFQQSQLLTVCGGQRCDLDYLRKKPDEALTGACRGPTCAIHITAV